MATRLVTVPVVVANLGLDGFGIWATITTTAAYMRFGSAGVRSAFQKYIAEATGTGDFEKANRLVSTGTLGVFLLSLGALIPTAIFARPLAVAAGVPPEFIPSAAAAVALLAVTMVFANTGAGYESVLTGGHRIDLVRKFSTVLSVLEAAATIFLVRSGYGLVGLSVVMAGSALAYFALCHRNARHVLPQIKIRLAYVDRSVAGELVRFAGSYQLVSVFEALYAAILPIAILRFHGAAAAGLYGIGFRLMGAALLPHVAFLVPILSGGSMVHGSGSAENMRLILSKSVKATLALAMFPLLFVGTFGPTILLAWTGKADPSFGMMLWLICLAGFFRSWSSLGRVLYRVSGRSLVDNIQQVIMILVLVAFVLFGRHLGLTGALTGMVAAELIGAIIMSFAVLSVFGGLLANTILKEAVRFTIAVLVVLAAAVFVTTVPFPSMSDQRWLAVWQLGKVALTSAIVAIPALRLTGSLSKAEWRALMNVFRRKVSLNA